MRSIVLNCYKIISQWKTFIQICWMVSLTFSQGHAGIYSAGNLWEGFWSKELFFLPAQKEKRKSKQMKGRGEQREKDWVWTTPRKKKNDVKVPWHTEKKILFFIPHFIRSVGFRNHPMPFLKIFGIKNKLLNHDQQDPTWSTHYLVLRFNSLPLSLLFTHWSRWSICRSLNIWSSFYLRTTRHYSLPGRLTLPRFLWGTPTHYETSLNKDLLWKLYLKSVPSVTL